jgi:hemerythrin-like domain-containing protein
MKSEEGQSCGSSVQTGNQSSVCPSFEDVTPIDAPDAYSPPALEEIDEENLYPYLKELVKEHHTFVTELNIFEATLKKIQHEGITKEVNPMLGRFFEFFSKEVIPHNRREERGLFPILASRLIEVGEHSKGAEEGENSQPTTAITVMEEEHLKGIQIAAVAFNLFGLASRLPDPDSRLLVLDAAVEQGKALVELYRLHIFREDKILFPLAQKHLTDSEMEDLL